VEYLKSIDIAVILFPAMGSHAGATAQGQLDLLAHYNVTEAFTGAPILSSMEVVQISKTEDGVPVYIDKNASQADWIMCRQCFNLMKLVLSDCYEQGAFSAKQCCQ
jgi:hypothetical protein